MVVSDAFVIVVGHTGIPDGIHPRLHQRLHMAVEQLGGIAHRIRGDGVLSLQVELAGGFRGEHHLKVQASKKFKPEGQVFVHIQAKGNTNLPPDAIAPAFSLQSPEPVVFIVH